MLKMRVDFVKAELLFGVSELFVKVNSCWVWNLTLQTGLWKLTLQIKHYIIKSVGNPIRLA